MVSSPRITFLDTARGMFLYWMIVGHSFGLASVSTESFLQMMRPKSWATSCFIMLTGFALAVIKSRRTARDQRVHLWLRAKNLFIIAIVSNILFSIAKHCVYGSLTASKLQSIVLFIDPWTMSAILLPYSLSLLIIPFFITQTGKRSPYSMFWGITVLNVVLNYAISSVPPVIREDPVFEILFTGNEYMGFPIVSLSFLCLWSFSLGVLFKQRPLTNRFWWCVIAVCVGSIAVSDQFPENIRVLSFFVLNADRFAISITFAWLISEIHSMDRIRSIFDLIGRSSILVFMVHRVLLQSENILFSNVFSDIELGMVLVVLTMLGVVAACLIRERNSAISGALKRIGF